MAQRNRWHWPVIAWLSVLLAWSMARLHKAGAPGIPFDAQHVYLPAALRLLSEGPSFLLTADSYRVAPLAYLWFALWGAEPSLVRLANSALFLACVPMLWRLGQLMGGIRAAFLATLLFVANPELVNYFALEFTEPLFIFGLLLLLLAAATLTLDESAWQPRRWVMLGAVGLTMTLLSRPVLQLIAPLFLSVLLWCAYGTRRLSPQARHVARSLSLMIALGLLPGALVVLKNGTAFGLWSIGTGAGAGLYLGVHPLTQGAEPAFVGLTYDVNTTAALAPASGGDHLQQQGDRVLRQVATSVLVGMSPAEFVTYFGRKLWWWLMHHPVVLQIEGTTLRALRVFELASIAAMCSLMLVQILSRRGRVADVFMSGAHRLSNSGTERQPSQRRAVFFCGVLALLALLLGQFVLVLYNNRYSTGFLDPLLYLLCAVSFATLTRPAAFSRDVTARGIRWGFGVTAETSWRAIGIVLGLAALVLLPQPVARWLLKNEYVAIDAEHTGPLQTVMTLDRDAPRELHNIRRLSNGRWQLQESPAALVMAFTPTPLEFSDANHIWLLRFAVHSKQPSRCRMAEIGLTHPEKGQALPKPIIKLKADGQLHTYVIHGGQNLRPAGAGDLRLAFHCPVGTEVQWDSATFARSAFSQAWQGLRTR